MGKICYKQKGFAKKSLALIDHANSIIDEYKRQRFQLTLRQLYYQFVSRALIPNNQQSYKQLGSVVNDARLAGLIDWESIEDRTRNLHKLNEWDTPGEIIDACASQFRLDKWSNQPRRVECWIEKEALAGVFERVCDELQVGMFACRGYTSQSEMWVASQRLKGYKKSGQDPLIIHFGDLDPSGVDMTRDVRERLEMFMGGVEVDRLALSMEQVEQYSPPPNPAKMTDTRASAYVEAFGDESWELDALEPAVLEALVRKAVAAVLDTALWKVRVQEEEEHRRLLSEVSNRWEELTAYL